MKKPILTILFISIYIISFSNTQTDSLRNVLPLLKGEKKLEVLKTLTHSYLTQSANDSCIFYGELTIDLAKKINAPEDEAYAGRRVGYAYQQLGDYKKSIEPFERALELFQSSGNKLKVAIVADLLSRSYQQTGNYVKGIEYFMIGENTGNELMNDSSISTTTITRYFAILYTNVGVLYFDLDSNDRALNYFNKALANAIKIKDTTRMAASYSNIGMIYNARNQYHEAINIYKESLILNRITNNSKYECTVLMNIAIVFDAYNQPDSAITYYFKSLEIAEDKGYKDIISSTHQNIGGYYSSRGDYDRALYHHRKSVTISKETEFYKRLLKNYFEISNIWKSQQVYDSALYYNELYNQLKDTIKSNEIDKEIADLHIKYNTQKKQQENIILRKDIEISKKLRLSLILGIVTLLIIATLTTFLLLFKGKMLKQKFKLLEQEKKISDLALENEKIAAKRVKDLLSAEKKINRLNKEKLEQKHRELSTITLHIINKNSVLNSMYREIEQHKESSDNPDITNCFNNLTNLIQGNQELDKNWEQFKLHFEEVYHGFFEKLNKEFPLLTASDHKLCAYIKMNLNTKEVAQMLSITAASVDKRRNRLRKKLELPKGVRLHEFINHLNQ
jgi:tetratricopeptide (TPR) repeat protein